MISQSQNKKWQIKYVAKSVVLGSKETVGWLCLAAAMVIVLSVTASESKSDLDLSSKYVISAPKDRESASHSFKLRRRHLGEKEICSPVALLPAATGDFNSDCAVDVRDIDLLCRNFGNTMSTNPVFLAPMDFDFDDDIDSDDFAILIAIYVDRPITVSNPAGKGTCLGDLNLDGAVDISDVFILVANLGSIGVPGVTLSYGQGDINCDGVVDIFGDAFLLLANLGTC